MELLIILFLFAIILISDGRITFKKNDRRVNLLYLTLLFISFVVLLLNSIDVTIPSPSLVIKDIINTFI